MISVCVPIFNTDVRALARQLSQLAMSASFPVELLFYDDFSDFRVHRVNQEIASLSGITLQRMEQNLGRSAIRNRLGRSARYPWLLFLDADSELPYGDFLGRYAGTLKTGKVICGGTLYHPEPPADPHQRLRWVYGRKREQQPAALRATKNKFAITANNFLISRELFLRHPFREAIKGYGHEDTVLGYDLRQAQIEIHHTDNPVFHTGLEPSEEYLEKTRIALVNLLFISREVIRDPRFDQASGLLKGVAWLKRRRLLSPVAGIFRISESLLRKNLTGPCPSLFLFDIYRLGFLTTLVREQQNYPEE